MASPLDYVSPFQQQGGGPFGAVMQGLQAGAQLSQLDAQRAQMAAQAEAARQKAEQQRVIDATLERFRTKPFSQVTVDDVAGLTGVLPAESMKVLAGMVASRSEAQNANIAVKYAQMLSAIKSGRIDVAQQLANDFAQSETDPQTKRGFEILGQGFAAAPDAAGKQIAVMMLGLSGKYAEYATKVLGTTEAAGRNISSPADKRAAGLVDADGAPLPGTFFVEPGKEPKLITSEKPKAGFKVLTPAEARARGLPADGFTWQINDSTGEVSSLAKPERGPLVSVKTEGPIPEGMQAVRDAAGNVIRYETIPGSPAAVAAQRAAEARQASVEGQAQTLGIVVQDIDRLTGLLNAEDKLTGSDKLNPMQRVTGVVGKSASGLPGSARVAAQNFVDTIKANVGFERLDRMRKESPTGGALGNITEQELKFLQATLGAIDLDAPPPVIRENLNRLKTLYNNIMRKAAAYPNAAQYGFAPGGAPAAPAAPSTAPPAAPGAAPRRPLSEILGG